MSVLFPVRAEVTKELAEKFTADAEIAVDGAPLRGRVMRCDGCGWSTIVRLDGPSAASSVEPLMEHRCPEDA